MKFGKFILRKIIELLAIKCSKNAPNSIPAEAAPHIPQVDLITLPRSLNWI